MATKRKSYTPADRARILAAAVRENLTGAQVAEKFGVRDVTFYNWRKRAQQATQRRPVAARLAANGASHGAEKVLTDIVKELIAALK